MSDYRLVPLTQGQFAKVSPHHYEWIIQWKWQARWTGQAYYAVRSVTHRTYRTRVLVFMHRDIMRLGPFKYDPRFADHINGDTLNNTEGNLRIATASQNQANRRLQSTNTSGRRGVHWCKRTRKWCASIKANGRSYNLGYFLDIEEAASAYVEAAKHHFGEFTRVA